MRNQSLLSTVESLKTSFFLLAFLGLFSFAGSAATCTPITTFPYVESFNTTTALPACWVADAGTGYSYLWDVTSSDGSNGVAGPKAGAGFAFLDAYDASDSYNPYTLTSPSFTLPASPQQLSYYYYLGADGYLGTDPTGSDPYPLSVQVSTNGGTSWTTIYDHSSSNSSFGSTSAVSNWHQNSISLAAYASQTIQIRYVANSDYGFGQTNEGIDEFTISSLPTCFPPTNVNATAITTTSATLNWTAPTQGTPAGYQWEVVAGGAGPYASAVASNYFVGTATTAATGSVLTPGTTYDIYVKTGCSLTDTSTWSAAGTFTTTCVSVSSLPYLESFNGANIPNCWSASAGTGYSILWGTTVSDASHGVSGPQAGTGFAFLDVFDASKTYNTYNLTSPSFVLPAAAQQLSYYYYLGNTGNKGTAPSGSDPYPLIIQVSTNGGTTWTDIYDHSTTNSTFATSSATSNWHQNTISLAAYINQTVKFRISSNSNYGSGYCNQGLDEFSITAQPSCVAPTLLTSSNVTNNTATISWTASTPAPASGYSWKVVAAGAGSSGTAVASGTTGVGVTTASVTGLTANTSYDVYVQANCGSGVSAYTAALTIHTSCNAITTLPWNEGFEGLAVGRGVFPSCWSTVNLAGTNYPGSDTVGGIVGTRGGPHTGSKFLFSQYNNTAWVFTPGFQLTAGTSYDFSFFMENVSFTAAGDFVMDVAYGTSASAASMTNSLISGNQTTNTSYQQFTRSFTPAASGVYYFGVKSTSTNLTPWYLSFDDFSLQLTPSCSAPNSLMAGTIIATGGNISWGSTPAGTANGYNWKVVASGAGSGGTAVSSGSTAAGITTATITGLAASTNYDVYVQSKCGGSAVSTWGSPLSITTPCAAITTIPWNEGFEGVASPGIGVFPPCWSSIEIAGTHPPGTDDGTITGTDGGPHAGSNFLYSQYNNTAWVFTPGFQLTAGTYYDFSFFMENVAFTGPGDFLLDVSYGTAATIAGMTNALITGNQTTNTSYQKFSSTFTPATTGVYYFGLKTSAPTYTPNYLSFDDFALTLTPACSAPSTISANAVTNAGSTIKWSGTPAGNTNGYNYLVVASGAGPTGTPAASGSTAAGIDSIVVSGLVANTAYDIYVQSRCAGSAVSSYTGPVTFSTLCNAITNIPWTEGFEGIAHPDQLILPACWSTVNLAGSNYPGTDNTTRTGTRGSAHGGSNFLYTRWSNTAWVFTPGFQLTAGTSYDFSFFLENISVQNPVDFTIDVAYGISATDAGMTNILRSGYVPTNTTYQRLLHTFTPATSGVYYFGVKSTSLTSGPWYLSFDDFSLQLTPACGGLADSLAISAIRTTSAVGKWTNATPLPAAGYNWKVVPSGAGAGTTAAASGTALSTVDSAIISGLTPNTAYDFFVQTNCGGSTGTGSWAGPVTFRTLCTNSSLPLVEGFNSTSIPSCWSQDLVTGTSRLEFVPSSTIPTTTPQEGTDFVLFNSASSYQEDTRLVSPPLTTTGTPSVDVQFYWYNENSTFANNGSFLNEGVTAQYSLDRVTWTNVQFFPRQDNSLAPDSGRWKKKTLTLPLAAGNQGTVYVGFLFHSELGDNSALDNINIFPSLACAGGPTAITVSNQTTTTAVLSWTAAASPPAGGYNWVVVALGDSATGPAIATGSTAAGVTTATATGLSANRQYSVYVRSNCGGGNGQGYWAGPTNFSTPCSAVTSLPWTEGFEGLTTTGTDIFPPCWFGVPATRWVTTNAPLGFPNNITSRSGSNYLYNSYNAEDTIFTPSFSLTGGTQYEFYFYYQTDGISGWDSIGAMYGTAQSQSGMTTRIGATVSGATNTGYVKYSAIFTPAASGSYYFGVKLDANSNPYNIAFDDFGLQVVVPCPNPPLAGAISGPASVCAGTAANLTLTGYSPYTNLQWQTSIDSINFIDIPSANSDQYTDYVSNVTYYRVKVNCADSTYSPIFAVTLTDVSRCYCTAGIGGSCGGNDIDTVAISGTNFFVNYTACNTNATGDAYTAFPRAGDSTAVLQRGGTYTIHTHYTGSSIASAWIDYNHDGSFVGTNASGDMEWVQLNTSGRSGTVTITVPLDAYVGEVGFRIRTRSVGSSNDSTSACDGFFSGETFDFVLTIADTNCNRIPTVVDTVSNVTCFGNTNGSIALSLTGGIAPFTHSWSSGGTTSTLTNLAAGSYTDTISFYTGCTYIYGPVVISQPNVLVAVTDSINAVQCFGTNTGNVYINVTGGTAPYAHHWNNGSTSVSLTGVAAGIYTDTVKDSHGCTVIAGPDTVRGPASSVTVTFDSVHAVKCNSGSTGAIYLTARGGVGPYTYLWSNAAQSTTEDVTGLTAGTYRVVVSDANHCTVTATDSVSQPSAISIRTDSIVNTKCSNTNDGSIYTTVSGGTLPYTYTWTGGSASSSIFFKPAGVYNLTVTDKNGCIANVTDTIKAPAALTITSTINNQIQGGALGAISLAVTGGTQPYRYHWNTNDSTASISNLAAGVYKVTVTDKNGCSTAQSDTVDRVLGIGEANGDIKTFHIYPNPSSGMFNVVLQLSHIMPVQIEVYSVTGQVIPISPMENPLNDTYQIDLSSEAAGVYFVKVKAGDNIMTQRVTVVK